MHTLQNKQKNDVDWHNKVNQLELKQRNQEDLLMETLKNQLKSDNGFSKLSAKTLLINN